MIANYHTHTYRCNHADGTEREYVEEAIKAGIKKLGFSDHSPQVFSNGYISKVRMTISELEDYVTTVLDLKKDYSGDIDIFLGLEAEYFPDSFDKLIEILSPYPFDYLLLAQHFYISEENRPYAGIKTCSRKLLKEYCDSAIEGMKTGAFTYFAHPDLIKYNGKKSDYISEMYRICETAKDMNIPLEINLLGLVQGRNYPSDKFWRLAGECGNTVVIGCDAHTKSYLNMPQAEKLAIEKIVNKYNLNLLNDIELKTPFIT